MKKLLKFIFLFFISFSVNLHANLNDEIKTDVINNLTNINQFRMSEETHTLIETFLKNNETYLDDKFIEEFVIVWQSILSEPAPDIIRESCLHHIFTTCRKNLSDIRIILQSTKNPPEK
jgi:hypothetical protein